MRVQIEPPRKSIIRQPRISPPPVYPEQDGPVSAPSQVHVVITLYVQPVDDWVRPCSFVLRRLRKAIKVWNTCFRIGVSFHHAHVGRCTSRALVLAPSIVASMQSAGVFFSMRNEKRQCIQTGHTSSYSNPDFTSNNTLGTLSHFPPPVSYLRPKESRTKKHPTAIDGRHANHRTKTGATTL